ncbi:glucose 1-dehydrogenase [Candidatus Sulfidibacterium hydrothermale]|jgi:NAD(P)-dependent dehydrogenase (short-subunit alcohol dehydrogenase family)|uniref:SDR family NAD(P)-dependent oxidoreductase n=1 Tax=Candidatus Sulfidibacterium hydrothermale TaxID=2875962 RepID=UPI001F0B37BE|nr:glucose 1-dehydrogenase [Candidatus Sulfidibacterium hydrothermale]UBM62511.1 glucose 1-dehydrogenase [Candidatus Sulfidibacterium hydrothermale]
MMTKFNLKGKVAIITGSSKGIGEAIARLLAENGATVVISSRKQEACDAVAEKFKADGLSAVAIACHVGNPDDRTALVEKTIEKLGGIDILVNNAGTNPVFGPVEEATDEIFDHIMNVNVKAPWDLANKSLESMKKRGGGSIINISSVEGELPEEGLGIYSTSKAALSMLTKSQAKEWGKFGIRVNAISPGLIKTKFSAALWTNQQIMQQIESSSPLGRMGNPEEIAYIALLLSSEAGSFITGSILVADGGFLLS